VDVVIYYKNWVSLNLVPRAFPYLELPLYLAAADGVMCDSEEEKLVWWAAHRDTLPYFVALVMPGGALPIMAYTGRLRPKGVPFSGFRYIKW